MRKLIGLLCFAIALPAHGFAYYLLPQPYTEICTGNHPIIVVRDAYEIDIYCKASPLWAVKALTMTADCGDFYMEPHPYPWYGWYRITCNVVPSSIDPNAPGTLYYK